MLEGRGRQALAGRAVLGKREARCVRRGTRCGRDVGPRLRWPCCWRSSWPVLQILSRRIRRPLTVRPWRRPPPRRMPRGRRSPTTPTRSLSSPAPTGSPALRGRSWTTRSPSRRGGWFSTVPASSSTRTRQVGSSSKPSCPTRPIRMHARAARASIWVSAPASMTSPRRC